MNWFGPKPKNSESCEHPAEAPLPDLSALKMQAESQQQLISRQSEMIEELQQQVRNLCSQNDVWQQQIQSAEKAIHGLREENESLLRACFQQDPWLRANRNLHAGERCYLLGCGPSLNRTDLTLLQDAPIMGVNGTYLLESVKLTYFASVSWVFWKHHTEGLKQFSCTRRFLPWHLTTISSDCPTSWINLVDRRHYCRLKTEHPWGFSPDPSRFVYGGGTVIYICLQILYHLGFSEIVLLGLDHDYGIAPHAIAPHGNHVPSETLSAHFREDYYKPGDQVHIDIHTMERAYAIARDIYAAAGRRIINATPGTKLEIFEKSSLENLR